MCEVYRNGKSMKVKNLGWLLRHWQEVESFKFQRCTPSQGKLSTVLMYAYLKSGGHFSCEWVGGENHAIDWCRRPVFLTLAASVYGSGDAPEYVVTL